ncbi:outer membrane beta-barrel protein [Geomesophilobacter sediminis]|uniref:Outer membrane beta-barrel protein n=1 Tax=Geomesophilobacter sediminis TaxID=2798584 RepID=A0A8J7J691_9BACT|nr:outer membrane beta-barrel protein [Geomesophilobacter sediminis]MBJ6724241.1 outer membrane beta-barrel protein [Geomesophilobacter sediminis]
MCRKPLHLIPLALLAFLTLPQAARAGQVLLMPSVTLQQEYNDNITAAISGGQGDFITTISPSLTLSDRSERGGGVLTTGLSHQEYLHHSTNSSTGYQLQGAGDFAFTPRLSGSASVGTALQVNPNSVDPSTGLFTTSTVHTDSLAAGGGYTLGALTTGSLNAAFSRQGYDVAGYLDTRQYSVQSGIQYDLDRVWRRLKVAPSVSFSREVTAVSTVDNTSATLSASRSLDQLWSCSLQAGGRYTHSSYAQGTASDDWGWLGSLAAAYAGEKLSANLAASHDVTSASGRGTAATQRSGGSATLSERLTPRLTGSLGGSYSWNRSLPGASAADRVDETTASFQGALGYEFLDLGGRSSLVLQLSYNYSGVEYHVVHNRSDQNRYLLSLVWRQQNFR